MSWLNTQNATRPTLHTKNNCENEINSFCRKYQVITPNLIKPLEHLPITEPTADLELNALYFSERRQLQIQHVKETHCEAPPVLEGGVTDPKCSLRTSLTVSSRPSASVLMTLRCPNQVQVFVHPSADSWTALWRRPAGEGWSPPRWPVSAAQRSTKSLPYLQCHTEQCGWTTTGRCCSSGPSREKWCTDHSGSLEDIQGFQQTTTHTLTQYLPRQHLKYCFCAVFA